MLGGLDSPLPKTSPIDVGGKHGATSSVIRWDLHLLLLSPPPQHLFCFASLGLPGGPRGWCFVASHGMHFGSWQPPV